MILERLRLFVRLFPEMILERLRVFTEMILERLRVFPEMILERLRLFTDMILERLRLFVRQFPEMISERRASRRRQRSGTAPGHLRQCPTSHPTFHCFQQQSPRRS